jgi:hypothetical protein
MSRRHAEVTWKEADRERIPDDVAEGAALVLDLERRGVLEGLGERVRIRREGGYCGFDVLLFLLLYFAVRQSIGLRKFWDLVRGCRHKLAALGRRRQLPSPASVSRALDSVEPELLRPVSEWLLSAGAGIDPVLRHPSVQTYDARGEGWHVFDFDPTVTTLRHRALPEGDDLPAARRRAKQASAGYAGRKRGDVQFRRGTLQHAGSGAWMQAMLHPGNGKSHVELAAALAVVVGTCERLGHPIARTLIRMDGEFGWVPFVDACRTRGVPCITRLTRPEMFEQAEVLRVLREGTWHFVPDSRSGPRRSALDLGVVTVPPGVDTRRPDGTAYAPIAVRVVCSRYPRTEKAEHGRVIDGWQYELFVVDAPADAFPAPSAVALYFGRAGLENRFAQEDREATLDRIFSYHLPGQEFAIDVGLWVWNLRLARGFELSPPPVQLPVQEAYVAEVDDRQLITSPQEPPAVANAQQPGLDPQGRVQAPSSCCTPSAVSPDSGIGDAAQPGPVLDAVLTPQTPDTPGAARGPSPIAARLQHERGDLPTMADIPSVPLPSTDPTSVPRAPGSTEISTAILEQLRLIDWKLALRKHPSWSWDGHTGHLRCPDGGELVLMTIRKEEYTRGRTCIVFWRPETQGCACDEEVRSGCFHSDRPRATKRVELSVPTPIADRLRELLRARRTDQRAAVRSAPAAPAPAAKPGAPRCRSPFPIAPMPPTTARFAVLTSLFLPAAARRLLRDAATGLTVEVSVVGQASPLPPPTLLAVSAADQQHRRKTWQQHFDRYALAHEAQVSVVLAGGHTLRQMLANPPVATIAEA